MYRSTRILAVTLLIVLGLTAMMHAEKVTLSWLVHDHPTLLDAWKATIIEYEKQNPDVTVELVVGPAVGKNYDDKMTVMAAGGTLPDVIYLASPNLISSGNVMELSPLIQNDPTFPALVQSWLPGVWNHSAFGNNRYMLTIGVAFLVTYINPNHFNEAGLALPTDDWNWDQFLEYATRLTRQGPNGVERFALELLGASNLTLSPAPIPFIYQAGGRLFDNHYDPTKSLITDEKVIEGLQFLHDLRWRYHVHPRPGEKNLTFITQASSMRIHFPARVADYAKVP